MKLPISIARQVEPRLSSASAQHTPSLLLGYSGVDLRPAHRIWKLSNSRTEDGCCLRPGVFNSDSSRSRSSQSYARCFSAVSVVCLIWHIHIEPLGHHANTGGLLRRAAGPAYRMESAICRVLPHPGSQASLWSTHYLSRWPLLWRQLSC